MKKKTTKEIILNKINNCFEENPKLFSKKAQEALMSAIETKAIHTKVNEDGKVFCNYFGRYLEENLFNKITKGDKLVYNSMSRDGTRLRQKELNAQKTRDKELSQLILDDSITNLDEAKLDILRTYDNTMEDISNERANFTE